MCRGKREHPSGVMSKGGGRDHFVLCHGWMSGKLVSVVCMDGWEGPDKRLVVLCMVGARVHQI